VLRVNLSDKAYWKELLIAKLSETIEKIGVKAHRAD
jgi:hypothetical protein